MGRKPLKRDEPPIPSKEILDGIVIEERSLTNSDDNIKAFEKIVKTLSLHDYLRKEDDTVKSVFLLTDLSPDEINQFSLLYAINSRLKSPILQEWITAKLLMKISSKRQGRKEITQLGRGVITAVTSSMDKMRDKLPIGKGR